MRILVAAGGTGGHIYPALAVLRSLAARQADLEVRWLGGRRGLESSIVPAAGYRLDRLWPALAAHGRPVAPHGARPAAARRIRAAGGGAAAGRWRPGRHLHHRRLRGHPGADRGRDRAHPDRCCGRATGWPAGACGRRRGWRRASRSRSRRPCEALPGPCFVTGTPIRSLAGIERTEARARLQLPADVPVLLVFGGSQAVRRFNDAVAEALPHLVERMRRAAPHRRVVVRRRAASGARRCPRAARAGTGPIPFLRDEMADALVAADLLVGRAGSSTLAEAAAVGPARWSWCPIRTPPRTRSRTPASWWRRARRELVADEDVRRRRAPRGQPDSLDDADGVHGCARRAASWAARRCARAVAELLLRAGRARPAARSADASSGWPGGRVTAATETDRPAPAGRGGGASGWAPTSSAASASRPRARSRWRGSPRCASAGPPTCSPRSTTSSSCAPSSVSPRPRAAAVHPGSRLEPGHQRRGHRRPRRARPGAAGAHRGRPPHRRLRACPWPRRRR